MAQELQDAWQRLTLTEEEEAVVVCEDETLSDREDQVALCLLGKLHTTHSFNVGAMKTVMKNGWRATKGVIIKELDCNLFTFQFFDKGDKEYVLNEGPWAFDGNILLLKQMTGLEQPSEVVFDKVRFWVKAYDVPVLKHTYNFAKFLGTQVGDFVDCNIDALGGIGKSLNFRVDVDIRRPLRRGVKTVVRDSTIWIRLKYVRLPDFCYVCGLLGHTYQNCERYDERQEEEGMQYGSWLRASPLKPRRRSAEIEQQEEKRLLLAYRAQREGKGARARLDFNTSTLGAQKGVGGHARMIIDNEEVVIPSGEFSKRRLLGKNTEGEYDKIRVMDGAAYGSSTTHVQAEVARQPRPAP